MSANPGRHRERTFVGRYFCWVASSQLERLERRSYKEVRVCVCMKRVRQIATYEREINEGRCYSRNCEGRVSLGILYVARS